ncbi:MAG: hypothetical protein ABW175_19355 [Bradyrhizobium sp.]
MLFRTVLKVLKGSCLVIRNPPAGSVDRRAATTGNSGTDLHEERSTDCHAKFWALLVFAVVVAYGPLALINQPLWDDWFLFAHSNGGTLWELFMQMGRRDQFMLMAPFAAAGEPRASIITVLLLFCLLAPLVYTIIRRTMQWSAVDAFWAALLTALIPLNQARFFLATVPYGFACVFFALSLVVLLRDLDRPFVGKRVLVALLLVMAFSTNSFLVLAWIAPAIVAVDAWRKADGQYSFTRRAGVTVRGVIGRGELVLLPLVYWAAKKIFEPTYGLNADYNKFRMGVPAALKQTVITFIDQFREIARIRIPSWSNLAELCFAAAVAIALFAAAARIWRLPLTAAGESPDRSPRFAGGLTVLVVLALIVSALFPYVIVGQPPRFSGLWETRHQTTLMMVSGFAIFALLRLIVPRPHLLKVAAGIAALFLVTDISITQKLVADALETRGMTNLFEREPSPPGTMLLVLEDNRDYRALGRFFPFYELSHMVNARQTGNPRLAISNQELIDPATGTYARAPVPTVVAALVGICEKFRSKPQYGFGGFISNGQIETVRLISTRRPPGLFATIGEALRANNAESSQDMFAMVRKEGEVAPIGGACAAPCCSSQ